MKTAAALILFATATLLAAGPPKAERAAVVTVLAESGAPLRDLKAADFVVKENGKKVEVIDAQLSTDTLSVALLLDSSQHTRGTPPTNELRAAASGFVRTILGSDPAAKIAIWQIASASSVMVDFTNKAEDLDSVISRLFFSQQTTASLLEALQNAGRQLGGRPGSRRAIVTVDFDSPEGSPDRMAQQAADSVTNSGATLWAVSAQAGGTASANRESVLMTMTKASGGKRYTILDPSALAPRLKGIAASLTSQYLVTFNGASDGPVKSMTFDTVRGTKVLATPFMR
jgi:von Willebrand factor type A domain